MPPGRRIPRAADVRKPAPDPPATAPPPAAVRRELEVAGGELSRLVGTIRACEACGRCSDERAFGSGHPLADVLLLKDVPSREDVASGAAFAKEAEPLGKAFERLGLPLVSVYGTCAVRCAGDGVTSDEIRACAPHLLVELEVLSPRVVVAFGPGAFEAVQALDGRCGISVPDEVPRGGSASIRRGLDLLVTEPLPQGVTLADAKRRLWADLQTLPSLLGP